MPEQKKFTLSAHDGTFIKTKDCVGVHFERILEHPVSNVWAALTEPEHLAHWLAPAVIEGGKGGSITLKLTGGVMGGKITEWRKPDGAPGRQGGASGPVGGLLEYAWHNGSTVRWELLREGKDRTRLVFSHCHVVEWQFIDAAKGWHYHLDLLALELDGQKMPQNPVQMWDEITREATVRYNEALKKLAPEQEPLVLERVFDAPAERVWQALTDREEIGQWLMEVDDFEPKEDFEFTMTKEHHNKRNIHLCRVMEVVDGKKLTYSFRFQNAAGITYVTWELFREGDKTRLRLTHRGLERIAHVGPDYARQNFIAGWSYFLENSLAGFLQRMPASVH